jgi:hypothetical protein
VLSQLLVVADYGRLLKFRRRSASTIDEMALSTLCRQSRFRKADIGVVKGYVVKDGDVINILFNV